MAYIQKNNTLLRKVTPEALAEIRKEPGKSNAGKYPGVKDFAGPDGTYPINDIERARAALSLAHHSPNAGAIKANVYKKWPQLKPDSGHNA